MTTQTEQPQQYKDLVDFQKVGLVENPYQPGVMQWELSIQWSFSKYPSKGWISVDSPPYNTGKFPYQHGKYWCIIEKGRQNPKYDGSQIWMYNYKLIAFDVGEDADAPTPSSIPVNAPSDAPVAPINSASIPKTSDTTNRDDHPNKRASIERQSWNNNRIQIMGQAKDIMVAEMNFIPDAIGDSTWEERLMHWYHILGETVFPDPDSDAPEDPESNEAPSQGASAPEAVTAELPWGTN